MNVLTISMTESDLTAKSLEFLRVLGLKKIAVTSPLKNCMFSLCDEVSEVALKLKSVNTVYYHKKWHGDNTDILGLKELQKHVVPDEIIHLWGGGGTKEAIKQVFPGVNTFSARTGKLTEGKSLFPDIVIWAVGRNHMLKCAWPPEEWKPQKVLDLNYQENSPGREYALKVGAEYISGLTMFKRQAEGQRQVWSSGD